MEASVEVMEVVDTKEDMEVIYIRSRDLDQSYVIHSIQIFFERINLKSTLVF